MKSNTNHSSTTYLTDFDARSLRHPLLIPCIPYLAYVCASMRACFFWPVVAGREAGMEEEVRLYLGKLEQSWMTKQILTLSCIAKAAAKRVTKKAAPKAAKKATKKVSKKAAPKKAAKKTAKKAAPKRRK